MAATRESPTGPVGSAGLRIYLLLTTALCGALVMVVEVLGSRVIGPFFGVSLFVWTALITVTLLALAVGYAVGGVLADRHPEPAWLYGLVAAAGVLVGLVPLLKAPVILLAAPLGLRGGALLSATLLFAPALVLLGCVSPYVVRIAARQWSALGRTVGILYALSTAGSFVGTAATGFFLIAHLGVSQAFYLCGGLLVALAAGYWLLFRRAWIAPAAALPFFMMPAPELPAATLADGTRVRLLDAAASFYGSVKVVEYRGAQARTREMMIDGLIQGGIDVADRRSIYEYPYLLEHLPLLVKPDARSALVVGLGPGVTASAYRARGIDVAVVDIDANVVAMAARHFGFTARHPVQVEDARTALARPAPPVDIVLLDVFTGDSTPSHLLSREALAQVRERLAGDGVLALNVIAGGGRSSSLPLIANTLRTQFAEVLAFPLFDPAAGSGGNVVLLAANRSLAAARVGGLPGVHPLAADGVRQALARARALTTDPGAGVLSDDFNPLDVRDAGVHEAIREDVLRSTPAAILLHG